MNPTFLYTHCNGHALNLAVKDACDKVAILKSTFETAKEAIKIDKDSRSQNTMPNSMDGAGRSTRIDRKQFH